MSELEEHIRECIRMLEESDKRRAMRSAAARQLSGPSHQGIQGPDISQSGKWWQYFVGRFEYPYGGRWHARIFRPLDREDAAGIVLSLRSMHGCADMSGNLSALDDMAYRRELHVCRLMQTVQPS